MKTIAIMAKSGTGKTTVIDKLCSERPDVFHYVKSFTTRPVRQNDPKDKESHIFVSEAFYERKKNYAFAVYNSPKGYHSWTDESSFMEDKINIYAIDSKEFKNLTEKCLISELHGIFLYIDENEREKRFLSRGEKDFDIEEHLDKKHLKGLSNVKILDVTNLSREETFSEVLDIIEREFGCKLNLEKKVN